MLGKLGGRGYHVQEEPGTYNSNVIDPNFDFDFENDGPVYPIRVLGQRPRFKKQLIGREKAMKYTGCLGVLVISLIILSPHVTAHESQINSPVHNYIELLLADLKTGKATIINSVMKLNDDEAKIFWPIYHEYEGELVAFADRELGIIQSFVDAHADKSLNNSESKDVAKNWFDLQNDRLKLWEKYHQRFRKSLSPVRAAQFVQVEYRISMVVNLMIASEMPLIDSAKPTVPSGNEK